MPSNASLSVSSVPAHRHQSHDHRHLHFTAALFPLCLSLSIWLSKRKVLHLSCQCPYMPPPHPLWKLVPFWPHQLHTMMKITLKRPVLPKLSLQTCLTAFPCSYLRSFHLPPLPPFTPTPSCSSLGVQSRLAMASKVPVWQGHIHAAAQPPAPRQGRARLCLSSASQSYAFVTGLWIFTCTSWKHGLNIEPAQQPPQRALQW